MRHVRCIPNRTARTAHLTVSDFCRELHVDVVLTDIEMPGAMNGFAFAKWACSVRPELDIVLAGTPERAAYAAGELCEHGPILTKPYDHRLVLDHIKRLVAARAQ
jgi:DNA-binding LytR/AlgR family response regulator